jgi:hypothetical protein
MREENIKRRKEKLPTLWGHDCKIAVRLVD